MTKVDPVSSLAEQQGAAQKKPRFTDREKRDELAREVNLRKVVYPGQVRAGRLTHAQAERQRDIMQEIWEEFRDRCIVADKEKNPELPLGEPKVIGVDPGAGDERGSASEVSSTSETQPVKPLSEDDVEVQAETEARENVREEPPPTEQPADQAASFESGAKPASE